MVESMISTVSPHMLRNNATKAVPAVTYLIDSQSFVVRVSCMYNYYTNCRCSIHIAKVNLYA